MDLNCMSCNKGEEYKVTPKKQNRSSKVFNLDYDGVYYKLKLMKEEDSHRKMKEENKRELE